MASFGKSIRIYLKDGTVTGIRIGEIVNQTIQSVACPRKRLNELKNYPEAGKPGIYFLFGEDIETGETKAYIGEAENDYERLQNHLIKKEFWSEVIFFVSKDENLTKSHVKYLESHAIRTANAVKRYVIENGNQSQASSLPLSDIDAMKEFMEYVKLLLGVFGHKFLEELTPSKIIGTTVNLISNSELDNISIRDSNLELHLSLSGLKATEIQTDEGVVVLPNSEAAVEVTSSISMGYRTLREKLINNGTLVLAGDRYVFQKQYLFDSPTPAAAIIVGYNISGPQNWKDISGKSLKDIEALKAVL